jgi:hypothetical protein
VGSFCGDSAGREADRLHSARSAQLSFWPAAVQGQPLCPLKLSSVIEDRRRPDCFLLPHCCAQSGCAPLFTRREKHFVTVCKHSLCLRRASFLQPLACQLVQAYQRLRTPPRAISEKAAHCRASPPSHTLLAAPTRARPSTPTQNSSRTHGHGSALPIWSIPVCLRHEPRNGAALPH